MNVPLFFYLKLHNQEVKFFVIYYEKFLCFSLLRQDIGYE